MPLGGLAALGAGKAGCWPCHAHDLIPSAAGVGTEEREVHGQSAGLCLQLTTQNISPNA